MLFGPMSLVHLPLPGLICALSASQATSSSACSVPWDSWRRWKRVRLPQVDLGRKVGWWVTWPHFLSIPRYKAVWLIFFVLGLGTFAALEFLHDGH